MAKLFKKVQRSSRRQPPTEAFREAPPKPEIGPKKPKLKQPPPFKTGA